MLQQTSITNLIYIQIRSHTLGCPASQPASQVATSYLNAQHTCIHTQHNTHSPIHSNFRMWPQFHWYLCLHTANSPHKLYYGKTWSSVCVYLMHNSWILFSFRIGWTNLCCYNHSVRKKRWSSCTRLSMYTLFNFNEVQISLTRSHVWKHFSKLKFSNQGQKVWASFLVYENNL